MSRKDRRARCECGQVISSGQLERHLGGIWHRNHRAAREMLDRGLSKAEIARQLGFSRAWAAKRFRELPAPDDK